jgi:hypothetical protein
VRSDGLGRALHAPVLEDLDALRIGLGVRSLGEEREPSVAREVQALGDEVRSTHALVEEMRALGPSIDRACAGGREQLERLEGASMSKRFSSPGGYTNDTHPFRAGKTKPGTFARLRSATACSAFSVRR